MSDSVPEEKVTLSYAAMPRRFDPRWLAITTAFGCLSILGLLELWSGRGIRYPIDGPAHCTYGYFRYAEATQVFGIPGGWTWNIRYGALVLSILITLSDLGLFSRCMRRTFRRPVTVNSR